MQRSMLAIPMMLIALGVLLIWIPYMLIYPNCISWDDNILCHADDPRGYWGWLGVAGIIAIICIKTAITMLKSRPSDKFTENEDNFH